MGAPQKYNTIEERLAARAESRRKYFASEKGKEAQRRAQQRYRQTEKGQLSQAKAQEEFNKRHKIVSYRAKFEQTINEIVARHERERLCEKCGLPKKPEVDKFEFCCCKYAQTTQSA